MDRTYLCFDLKNFYASVECVTRGLDPLTTNLVVADVGRTEKTICLAVTPSLKAYGIPGRARLFEVIQKVEQINRQRKYNAPHHRLDCESYKSVELSRNPSLALSYIAAPPRMAYYMEYSTKIYNIYLKYADIINLPRHELTTRQRMPRINRAASFSPFAALTGYDDQVKEAGRLTDERIELDDGTISTLNDKLNYAVSLSDEQPEISVTYFNPDSKKNGGAYITHTGIIKRIDEYERKVIFADKTAIPIDDIYGIDGEIFIGLY